MDKSFFTMVIQEIESIYGGLKLTKDQVSGWYSRLKNFTEDEARLAVDRLIKQGFKPNYIELEKQLKFAHRAINPDINILSATYLVEKGRVAPFTDELIALTKDSMQGLATMMKMRKGQAKQEVCERLKENWLVKFKELPDCTEQNDVLEYARRKDIKMLELLGVLNPMYPKEKVFVPIMHIEKQYGKTQDIETTDYYEMI